MRRVSLAATIFSPEATVPTSTFTDTSPSAHDGDDVSQARSRVAEIGHRAVDAIDDKRDAVAQGMGSAAARLHERAASLPGGEQVVRAAHRAAGAMETAAGYLRDHDLESMLDDVRQVVKRRPGATLLVVAAVGFLLGRAVLRHR
jgi:ElaB/YqjD/DUF883 family membrane-anchored ribosome-binding protein